jgi:hypothetical protein
MDHHAALWLLNAFHDLLLELRELYVPRESEFMPLRPVETCNDQTMFDL